MAIVKYEFKPGVNKDNTNYSNEFGWFDSNLVRFKKGLPEKIGGWAKYITTAFLGKCRALHQWVNLNGTAILGLGTTFKYYIARGNEFVDITPIRKTNTGTVSFAASNGSSTITVTDSGNHDAQVNDFVTFSGVDSDGLGGNITQAVLQQNYQIVSVTSTTVYTITAKDTSGNTVTANSSDTNTAGGSVVAAYEVNVGLDATVIGTGWSTDSWGAGTWGSTSPLSAVNQLRIWTHDNFGEDLIINPRAGSIYYYDESNTNTRAVELAGKAGANKVPTKALQVIVSEKDRHLIVLGADPLDNTGTRTGIIDPMLVAFSDQENALEFEALSTNTAGSLRISSGAVIIGGIRAREETLIFTDSAMFSMQFIGPPFTFGVNMVNEGIGCIGPKAMVNVAGGVYWMDYTGFYFYNGTVQPIPCSVQDYVFDDFNVAEPYKTFAFSTQEFNEVGWFYCSANSAEIDRYVVFNYLEQVWSVGQLQRHAWLDAGINNKPLATGTDSTNYLYEHEVGNDDDGSAMANVFIESSDFDIADGEEFSFLRRIIPDIKFNGSAGSGQGVKYVLKNRDFNASSLTTSETKSVLDSTTKIDVRVRARQLAFRIEGDDTATGVGWRLGATRFDLNKSGKR